MRSFSISAITLTALGANAHASPPRGGDSDPDVLVERGGHYHVAGGIVTAVGGVALAASVIALIPHDCDPAGGDCIGYDLFAAVTLGGSAAIIGTGLLLYHHGTELIEQANQPVVTLAPVPHGVGLAVIGRF
jgi:hypothetical protein